MAGQKREARLRARRPAIHIVLMPTVKTWMPGTRPGMTKIMSLGVRLFSIPVMIRLERAFRLDADIFRLVGPQFRQLDADLGEMQPRHLLVERFRQHIDLLLVFAVFV